MLEPRGRRHRAHSRLHFDARLIALGDAEVQLLRARHRRQPGPHHPAYVNGAIGHGRPRGLDGRAARGRRGRHRIESRFWFNEANDSRYFLVPGLIVLIMTLIGALLTTLVMAREWERGTLEALFVTPVRAGEILLGKTIPYFVLGMMRLGAVRGRRRILFHVPLRGSLAGAGRRVDALPAGGAGHRAADLLGSPRASSSPVQITILVTFLPAMMLSGFLFDLRSMPVAVRRSSPTSCRPATSWPCCRPSSWPATCGRSSCPTRPCWPAWRSCFLVVATAVTQKKTGVRRTMSQIHASHPRADPQGTAGDPERPPQPGHAVRAADHAVPVFRLRGHLRPERRSLRRARPGPQRRLARSCWPGSTVRASFAASPHLDRAADRSPHDRRPPRAVGRRRSTRTSSANLHAGQPASVQVIADGRNSNTAGTAHGLRRHDRRDVQRRLAGELTAVPPADPASSPGPGTTPTCETRWNMIPGLIGTLTMMQMPCCSRRCRSPASARRAPSTSCWSRPSARPRSWSARPCPRC